MENVTFSTEAYASGNTTASIRGQTSSIVAQILQICFTVILCFIMLGVGCAGDFSSIWKHFRRPAAICTGIFNQFVIMPLLAVAFVYATGMPQTEAMAVLVQGTAPGGMMSNIITYWIKGDINLSISMTSLSTLIALGTMPLWLFIFTNMLKIEENLRIPFDNLGIALAAMVFPVIIGLMVRKYKPEVAKVLTKVLTVCGTIAIIVALVVSGIISELSFVLSWQQWVVAVLTPIIGIVIGYLTASLPCLNLSVGCRRTIAIETGFQNCQISQSVLVITYASNILIYEKVRLFPLLNSGFQIIYGILLAVLLARLRCLRKSCDVPEVKPEEVKAGIEIKDITTGNATDTPTPDPDKI